MDFTKYVLFSTPTTIGTGDVCAQFLREAQKRFFGGVPLVGASHNQKKWWRCTSHPSRWFSWITMVHRRVIKNK